MPENLLIGFEVDLNILFKGMGSTHGGKFQGPLSTEAIINYIHDCGKWPIVDKRTWLTSKREMFIYNYRNGNVIGLALDSDNIEVSTLPLLFSSGTIESIIWYFVDSLAFASEILYSAGVDEWTIMLPYSLPGERITGWQINLSSDFLDNNHWVKDVFGMLTAVFSMTFSRNFAGKRSLRVSHLTPNKCEINDDEQCIPLIVPDRRSSRGNGVSVSLPGCDFCTNINDLQRFLGFILSAHTYFATNKGSENGAVLAETSPDLFVKMLKEVNRGNVKAADVMITLLERSLDPITLNYMNVDILRNAVGVMSVQKYYEELCMAHFLHKSRTSLHSVKKHVLSIKAVLGKGDSAFIPDYFESRNNWGVREVLDLDWNLSSVVLDDDIVVIPNKLVNSLDCALKIWRRNRFSDLLHDYACAFDVVDIENLKIITGNILSGGLQMFIPLKQRLSGGKYSNEMRMAEFLAWVALSIVCNSSSLKPFKISIEKMREIRDRLTRGGLSLLINNRVASQIPNFFRTLFYNRNRKVHVSRIVGPEWLSDCCKYEAFDFECVSDMGGSMLVYEENYPGNISSYMSLMHLYDLGRIVKSIDSMEIDREFMVFLLNRITIGCAGKYPISWCELNAEQGMLPLN